MKLLKAFAELNLSRIFLMSVFIGALYFMFYFDSGKSIEEQIAAVQATVAQEENRKSEINKTMKKEEEMRGNVLLLQRNLEVVTARIPKELKDSQVQSIINAAAGVSGVKITGLSSVNSSTKDPNAPPVKILITEAKPENLVDEVRFKISLVATFDDFLKFLDTLAKEDKVIKIKNFDIKKSSDNIDDEMIRFEGDIIGFKQANIQIVRE